MRPSPRVVFLVPYFRSYRVPVFDRMSDKLGGSFHVVIYGRTNDPLNRAALKMGHFKRVPVRGWDIRIREARYRAGLATPTGLTLAPGLPFALRRLRPDVVISSNFGLWSLVVLLMGYPCVIYFEGTRHTERTVHTWRLKLRRWMARRADALIVNGLQSKAYMTEDLGAPEDKVHVDGICAEPAPAEFAGRGPAVVREGEPVRFLFMGRLVKLKGLTHLLAAVAKLHAQTRNFELVVAGDGPEKEAIESEAARLGIAENIRFAGYVSPEEVWPYYRDNHVFVLPTLHDNWPLVAAEAMSMGMPVLLSRRAGSVHDLIREGENGYSFDPEDHEELATAMAAYLDDPARVEKDGAQALEAIDHFTPENVADAYIAAARAALTNRSG